MMNLNTISLPRSTSQRENSIKNPSPLTKVQWIRVCSIGTQTIDTQTDRQTDKLEGKKIKIKN
jgi:hypothetical protein